MIQTKTQILSGVTLLAAALVTTGCATTKSVEPFPLEDSALEIFTTEGGVEYVVTPDDFFENLPGWTYEPKYVEIDGLRQAYYEAGPVDGEVILLIHGEPNWSYLYRKMIPLLADAGYRVIAMDHLGFGRSDKPIDLGYYSYTDHVSRMEQLIYELELEHITAFVQDWGSLIGLNVIGNNTELFDRVVMGNGTLPELEGFVPQNPPEKLSPMIANAVFKHHSGPAQQEIERDENGVLLHETNPDGFGYWIAYALSDERIRPGMICENGTYFDITDEEERAYDAPYPANITLGGVRTMPSFINSVPQNTVTAWEGLRSYDKPFLTIIGNNDTTDLGSVENQNKMIENIPGAKGQPHTRLIEAGHFLQDDQGPEIVRIMLEFMAANPVD